MWILAVTATFILVCFAIFFLLIFLICGASLREIFLFFAGMPWQLYAIFGGLLAAVYLLFLCELFFSAASRRAKKHKKILKELGLIREDEK